MCPGHLGPLVVVGRKHGLRDYKCTGLYQKHLSCNVVDIVLILI